MEERCGFVALISSDFFQEFRGTNQKLVNKIYMRVMHIFEINGSSGKKLTGDQKVSVEDWSEYIGIHINHV